MIHSDSVEAVRRIASVVATTIFAGSFLLLLGLSATDWWTPANPWLGRLQCALQAGGLAALILAVIPPFSRASTRIAIWLGLRQEPSPD